jgi:hydrogenase nickel incorporation protein HypB
MCSTCGCGQVVFSAGGEASGPDSLENCAEHHSHGRDDLGRRLHDRHDASADEAMRLQRDARRLIALEQDILAKNKRYADNNRRYLSGNGVLTLNLVASPGAGKTTLLLRSIHGLKTRLAVAVIEGDQQTSRDADRIAAAGAPVIQINTGRACHLDAHAVGHALEQLTLPGAGVLFIENVGNLVCPADFDLGETRRVVLLSVVEGDDKPLKYPNIFASADLMLLTKMDLLPYVSFDVDQCITHARHIHPAIEVISLSSKTGEGFSLWYDWIERQRMVVPLHR